MKILPEKIQEAAALIESGDFESAREKLKAALAEIPSLSVPMGPAVELAADAEEYLAEIGVKTKRFQEAIAHAQQAIVRSQRFRPKANFLAAEAFAGLGNTEMAIAKLQLVVEFASHPSLAEAARERIKRLEEAGN